MKLHFLALAVGALIGLFSPSFARAESFACQRLFLPEDAPKVAASVEFGETVGLTVLKSTSPDPHKIQMLNDLLEGVHSVSEFFLLQFLNFVPHQTTSRGPWTRLEQAITHHTGHVYRDLPHNTAPVELIMLQTALLKTKLAPNRDGRNRLFTVVNDHTTEIVELALKQANLQDLSEGEKFKYDVRSYFQSLVTDAIYPELKTSAPAGRLN